MYKRKLFAVIAAVLACLILLISASYAWFTLSSAPEITGIETHVGTNGNLEIALLWSETYENPSRIQTGIGGSALVQDMLEANKTWGNIVELSDSRYGLQEIVLRPSRLNVREEGGLRFIGDNMLQFPEYRFDGRLSSMLTNTVTATYKAPSFIYSMFSQDYGVRAIGSVSNLTPHQSSLASARSHVRTYRTAAVSAIESIWKSNGVELIGLYLDHYQGGVTAFTDADVAVILDSATRAATAISYLDFALRQGIVGYGASAIADEATFLELRNVIENTAIPLSMILERVDVELPSNFVSWVEQIEADATDVYRVVQVCNALRGGRYSWEQIGPLLDVLFSDTDSYINEQTIASITPQTVMGNEISLSLLPQAGVLSAVSDYTGNYQVSFSVDGLTTYRAETVSGTSPAHLVLLAERLDELSPAATGGYISQAKLADTYGYAIDLAFRCNEDADLLLQTFPLDRVENQESADSLTQGNGSFMSFKAEKLSIEQTVSIMDALRVAFVDNKNQVVALAKLNISNYAETADGIKAPLYLYDYAVSADSRITVGGRREERSAIASMTANAPYILTAIVWLDGDHVDNLMASISDHSITGALNLQFASSADLKPVVAPVEPAN